MWLYKEYCDENAYGEEIVELYEKREDAIARLKERIADYDVPFEQIPKELGLTEDDTFQEDYVSIRNNDGSTSFWIVEEIQPISRNHEPVLCGKVINFEEAKTTASNIKEDANEVMALFSYNKENMVSLNKTRLISCLDAIISDAAKLKKAVEKA